MMYRITFIERLEWWAERDSDVVVAWRLEEVTSMRRVDIEKDTRNNDRLFFQQLLEECLQGDEITR